MKRTKMLIATLLSLATTFAALGQPVDGSASAVSGLPTRATTENLSLKRYVSAGDRAYEVGAEDGTFPQIGWHITGHMGGVWAHPIKLLNSYRFLINSVPLPDANKFTSGAGYVEFSYPETHGLQITRTVFAPDGVPAVLVGLTLRNASNQTQSFRLLLEAVSDLIPAYPWASTKPTSEQLHQPDQVKFEPAFSGLVFNRPDQPFYALVSGLPQVANGRDSANFVRAFLPGSASPSRQAVGLLIWQVNVTAGSELKLWFTVAGSHTGRNDAYLAGAAALYAPDQWLQEKLQGRAAILALSDATIPDATLQSAFNWAKLDLADMRRVVTSVNVRDTQEGKVYPPPLAFFSSLSGFGAGYPDYPWFFGTDGCYTVFPLVAAGQFQAAKDHLTLLREVSRAVNGSTGKVLHEIVTDGSIYFGTKNQPGDTNETPEFTTAVATLWRWTGDNQVRDDNYQFMIDGLHYVTSALDVNGDGWPEGAGMVESPGMGAEKLDVAVYTIRGLNDLAEMAAAKGDQGTQEWAAAKAGALLQRFERDWWYAEEGLYADSLALDRTVSTDPPAALGTGPVTKLEQRYWINATPMETGFASVDHAATAFAKLESSIFTGPNGFYQAGIGGGPDGKGDLESSALNTSVMAVAEGNYGRADEALRYALDIARQLDLEQPGALPELMPSPGYDPFQPFTKRAMVMQAWSSYGVIYPVIRYFLGVEPHAPQHLVTVVPQLPGDLPQLSVTALQVGDQALSVSARHSGRTYETDVTLPAGYRLEIGHTVPSGASIESVTLNGRAAGYTVRRTQRGSEVIVTVFVAGAYHLQVQTH